MKGFELPVFARRANMIDASIRAKLQEALSDKEAGGLFGVSRVIDFVDGEAVLDGRPEIWKWTKAGIVHLSPSATDDPALLAAAGAADFLAFSQSSVFDEIDRSASLMHSSGHFSNDAYVLHHEAGFVIFRRNPGVALITELRRRGKNALYTCLEKVISVVFEAGLSNHSLLLHSARIEQLLQMLITQSIFTHEHELKEIFNGVVYPELRLHFE